MAAQTPFPTRQEDDFFTITGNAFRLIKRSWQAVRLNLTTIVLVYLVPLLAIMGAITVALPFLAVEGGGSGGLTGMGIALLVIGFIGAAVLSIMLTIASVIVQLASVRGKKISFSEALNQAWPFFLRMIILGVLSALVIIAGLVLLIVPGILAVFFLTLATYVLIDQKTGVVEAMRKSFELTKANWKLVLAVIVVQIAISVPSVLIPYLGSVVTTGLTIAYFCLTAIIYLRIAGKAKQIAPEA